MTETQKRIEAYQKALPGIREKVTAVAMLLALSVIMLTSASFAWLTISRAPEVSQVATNVAANGNLEIALATGDGKEAPDESKVGDSAATKGQTTAGANITWGNLINLNDPSYGLENLVLKPAQLNEGKLLEEPLFGAEYTEDGRIEKLNSKFAYTSWYVPEGSTEGIFGTENTTFGVRAISSVEVEFRGADAAQVELKEKIEAAKDKNNLAANKYANLAKNSAYMNSLAAMMGKYLTATLNYGEVDDFAQADVENLRNMYSEFLECYDLEAEAIAMLINAQMEIKNISGVAEYDKEKVYAFDKNTNPLPEGVTIKNLDIFVKDRNTIKNDLVKLDELIENAKYSYADLDNAKIIDNLVDVGKCKVGDKTVDQLAADKSDAIALVMGGGTHETRITNGILKNFEERTGGNIDVNMTIKAKYLVEVSLKAHVCTDVNPEELSYFESDAEEAESNLSNMGTEIETAQDTYGLAIDLWVRTNASGSYLTLEGNVLTEREEVLATGKDSDGNEVDIYTISRAVEDGSSEIPISESYDLYKVISEGENGEEVVTWYNAETYSIFELEDGEVPKRKLITIITVTGYEGENRVWNGSQYSEILSTDATTQGSGSCYVYYADTPEDQARSLELLSAFNVAFINQNGKLLATAKMDTERFFAESGRVTVPLVLDPAKSTEIGTDDSGNKVYGITALEKNVATRITAIVYLDGTKLGNENVLSASDIQGQLNIQFGSSQILDPIEDEGLQSKYRTITAAVSRADGETGDFEFDTDDNLTVNVEITVDGEAPKNMEAFFIRQINTSQGSREETFMLEDEDLDGKWTGSYEFDAPGKYILRTVKLDGQEYVLDEPKEIVVKGFTVESFSYGETTNGEINGNKYKIMTAEGFGSTSLRLKFASDDVEKMPKTVQGKFLRSDGVAVNVNFSYNASGPNAGFWTGSVTFLNSGEYTLQYLVLDGEYTELAEGLWKYADITLGMRVAIYTTSPTKFKFVPSEMTEEQRNLGMQVKIYDNAGTEKKNLSGVSLTFGMRGSATKTMDTDLVWNGEYYTGNLESLAGGPGIWEFRNVTISSNTINAAITSPTFTIQSPEPPEYYDENTASYQYVSKGSAVMSIRVTNSSAASAGAYIVNNNKPNDKIWVDGLIGAEFTTTGGKPGNTWNFAVPEDAEGWQDGNWTLVEVRMWDVFAASGEQYTEEDPLVFDLSDEDIKTKVVQQINVKVFEEQGKNFSENGFLVPYTLNEGSISVEITDFEGEAILKNDGSLAVSDVVMTFTYINGTSKTYGGYESESLNNGTTGATIPVELGGTSINFTQSLEETFLYAGKYETKLEFKINGTPITTSTSGVKLTGTLPKITVSTIVPSVKITDISNKDVEISVDNTTAQTTEDTSQTTGSGCNATTTFTKNIAHQKATPTISSDGLTANVYFKCFHDGTETYTGDRKYHCYYSYETYGAPQVTLTLNNITNYSSAQLDFKDSSNKINQRIYSTTTSAKNVDTLYHELWYETLSAFTWNSSSKTSTRVVGYSWDKAGRVTESPNATGKKIPAGTITANQLTVVGSDGNTYVFTIPTITIYNPY